MRPEEEFLDVLQNIEWAIVEEFHKDRSILDIDVRDAVTAIVRLYEAELESRGAPNAPLSDRAKRILDPVRAMCEWRLGRASESLQARFTTEAPEVPVSVEDLILCLKRIRKSIDRWNKEGGRQGYLSFVEQYVV